MWQANKVDDAFFFIYFASLPPNLPAESLFEPPTPGHQQRPSLSGGGMSGLIARPVLVSICTSDFHVIIPLHSIPAQIGIWWGREASVVGLGEGEVVLGPSSPLRTEEEVQKQKA